MSTIPDSVWNRLEAELRENWGKGRYGLRSRADKCCLVGACMRVATDEGSMYDGYVLAVSMGLDRAAIRLHPDRVRLGNAVMRQGMDRENTILEFNDNEATTLDDVLAVVAEARAGGAA